MPRPSAPAPPEIWTVWIPGRPVPQARPRFRRLPSGQIVTYEPARSRAWKTAVAAAARAVARPWPAGAHALGVSLRYHVPCPTAPRTGDLDNLVKATLDALRGVLYEDDRWVVELEGAKQAPHPQQGMGTRITAWRSR